MGWLKQPAAVLPGTETGGLGMDRNIYEEYVRILEEELVPAMGCTEPIAVAYAGAIARKPWGPCPTGW